MELPGAAWGAWLCPVRNSSDHLEPFGTGHLGSEPAIWGFPDLGSQNLTFLTRSDKFKFARISFWLSIFLKYKRDGQRNGKKKSAWKRAGNRKPKRFHIFLARIFLSFVSQKTTFSLVNSRLSLVSPGCSFVTRPKLPRTHEMVVDYIWVIKAIGKALFPDQTRLDQTSNIKGMTC